MLHAKHFLLGELSKTTAATAALGAAGYLSQGGAALGQVPMTPESWWEFAARQGGALAVLFAVLFFYRRDYKALADYWKLDAALKAELLEKNVRAMAEVSSAMRENTVVVHSTKNVMQDLVHEVQVMQAVRSSNGRGNKRDQE